MVALSAPGMSGSRHPHRVESAVAQQVNRADRPPVIWKPGSSLCGQAGAIVACDSDPRFGALAEDQAKLVSDIDQLVRAGFSAVTARLGRDHHRLQPLPLVLEGSGQAPVRLDAILQLLGLVEPAFALLHLRRDGWVEPRGIGHDVSRRQGRVQRPILDRVLASANPSAEPAEEGKLLENEAS